MMTLLGRPSLLDRECIYAFSTLLRIAKAPVAVKAQTPQAFDTMYDRPPGLSAADVRDAQKPSDSTKRSGGQPIMAAAGF
jgi:hypothetical protein